MILTCQRLECPEITVIPPAHLLQHSVHAILSTIASTACEWIHNPCFGIMGSQVLIMGTDPATEMDIFCRVTQTLGLRLRLTRNKLLELDPVVETRKRMVWHRGPQESTERFPPIPGVPFQKPPTLSEPPHHIIVPSEVVSAVGYEVIAPAQAVILGGERCHR